MDFGNIFHKNSELKEYLWQHTEVTEYVLCPPPVQMCFANLWGQIMQWSVVKKVGKNKYSTNFILYHTSIYRYINDSAMCHFAQEVVIICTLVAHIGSTICNHFAQSRCIKCARVLSKFTPIPPFSKGTRYVLWKRIKSLKIKISTYRVILPDHLCWIWRNGQMMFDSKKKIKIIKKNGITYPTELNLIDDLKYCSSKRDFKGTHTHQ